METEAGAETPGPAALAAGPRPDERSADAGRLVITCPDRPGIVAQDTARVDHRSPVDDLRQLGQHAERAVHARAVGWHLKDQLIVQNRTIVFS